MWSQMSNKIIKKKKKQTRDTAEHFTKEAKILNKKKKQAQIQDQEGDSPRHVFHVFLGLHTTSACLQPCLYVHQE